MSNNTLKIGVTGASGMLGSALVYELSSKYKIFATSRTRGYSGINIDWQLFDLLDRERTRRWLQDSRPDYVIHAAAMIDLNSCEQHQHLAQSIHVDIVELISSTLSSWNGKLIYISTDAVFDGSKEGSYNEQDIPNPLNNYGKTKREGEIVTLSSKDGIVLRTNIFGWSRKERYSFSEWILKGLIENSGLSMFHDVVFAPIYVSHLAGIMFEILSKNIKGLFHVTGDTILSKYEYALNLAKIFNLNTNNIHPASIEDAGLKVQRPKNMSLDNSKLSKIINYKFPIISDGLKHLKEQYDNGWLAKIKGRHVKDDYRFWEEV